MLLGYGMTVWNGMKKKSKKRKEETVPKFNKFNSKFDMIEFSIQI